MMWVFQGSVGTVYSSAAEIRGGSGGLATFTLPAYYMIRVTICDIPGSGGFF